MLVDEDVDSIIRDSMNIRTITFGNLISTAEKKMILNKYLKEHYEVIDSKILVEKTLKRPFQNRLF